MLSIFSDLKQFINTDALVLNKKDLTKKEMYPLVKANHPRKVFIINEENIHHIRFSEQTNQFFHLTCCEVSANEKISSLIDRLKDYELLIVKDKKGNILGYVDSSELCIKLFTAYQHLQAYISTILDTTEESCTVIDSDESVIGWTKGAEQIFSFKQEEIVGKPITEFFHNNLLEILKTLKDGTSVHHRQHKARENQVVLINSNPVYFNDAIIGAVVSETDITSQIKLNKELYHATEKIFRLEKEVNKLTSTEDPFIKIRGSSTALKKTIKKMKKAASTNTNILIHGESGVGKELFAKAVHNIREREEAPFVAINCGAIPSSLFESEIFGYEKGAFSGADQKGKKGKAQLAKGGTLFLDEIGEMPLEMQVKILRLLQEKRFYPVGGTKEIEVDFRVVAATNRDLKGLIHDGQFREDLYYRLNVVSIEVPPLRKRPEDIIELTHYFLHEISIKYNRPIHGISQTVMQALLRHEWYGNIRELKNVIERLVVFSEDGEIKVDDIPFETAKPQAAIPHSRTLSRDDDRSLSKRLQEVEKEIILKELKKVNGNKLSCAQNLQITRATLYNRLNKLDIKT
ncbi:sigma 54-interacting transcriptional regulator [Halobacillus shinanisalinarum]|uniref:Sigma 54-interacting transcriptional regulator n=1 Tax=Halobacillus shinanisalinarum TaxID=2932258 RepID=A0ABY4H347_9BACI|nr:sigma 54-interacting transcriptional regulator [Halobacillus shinanisalinarum]UOQ94779.1 sigma 54-interacting transcriptional regulator [Halobacillus shinanisalinarum]